MRFLAFLLRLVPLFVVATHTNALAATQNTKPLTEPTLFSALNFGIALTVLCVAITLYSLRFVARERAINRAR